MPHLQLASLSRLRWQGEPVINPKRLIKLKGRLAEDRCAASLVPPFLEAFAKSGDFGNAWDVMVAPEGGIMASMNDCVLEMIYYYLRPDLARAMARWWNPPKYKDAPGLVSRSVIQVQV